MSYRAYILLFAFLFSSSPTIRALEVTSVSTLYNKNPAHYSAQELNILNVTYYLDRPANYVEIAPQEQWFASWLTQKSPRRSARSLASAVTEIDEGSSGGTANSSDDMTNVQWKKLEQKRIRSGFTATNVNYQEISIPGTNSSWSPVGRRTSLDAADGYRYYQNLVIQCAPDYQPGDTCLVVGSVQDFEVFGSELYNSDSRGGTGFLPTESAITLHEPEQVPLSTEMASSVPGPTTSTVIVAQPAPAVSTVSAQQQQRSEVAFQSCQQTYDKALKLCGSSTRKPDRDFVLEKLKIVAPSHYAGYLTYVRQLNEQGLDLAATCKATEEVAQSMTALNVYYDNLCTNARDHCASECSNARAQSLDVNDLNHNRSQEFADTCTAEMNLYAASGLFQHSEASRILASARDCKEKLAQLGPCAEVTKWDTPQCQQHCEDPANASLSACVRYQAMTSNCKNPEYAKENSYCQGPDTSREIAKSSPGGSISGSFTVPKYKKEGAGSFGSGKDPEASFRSSSSPSAQKSKAGAPRSSRTVYVTQGSQDGSATAENKSSEPSSFKFVINFADEFERFWHRIRPRSGESKGARNKSEHINQRHMSSENKEPVFNFAKYVFRTETDSNGQKRCYRGAELLLCPDRDIFQAISRKYRSIAPGMNK